MLNTTTCSVWTFDPTLDAAMLAKVNAVPGLHFTPVGLADKDGKMVIAGKDLPVRTLHTLMRERGHAWVDVLRMDIEGGEWSVFNDLIQQGNRGRWMLCLDYPETHTSPMCNAGKKKKN